MDLDQALTTTRAVRRRLDLDRPVSLGVLKECLTLAFQAPTAGGVERWRWLFVTEKETRADIATLYREASVESFRAAHEAARNDSTRRAYAGALALAETLEHVPVLVIPCLNGEPRSWNNQSAAPFYGSIFPAVWSFQLALRSRGLGSTLTTAHLKVADRVGQRLAIPEDVTQVGLLPVAYTLGTNFKPATRATAEDVAFLERWGSAFGSASTTTDAGLVPGD